MQPHLHEGLVQSVQRSIETTLSARERQILRSLAAGASNMQLAGELGLSIHTVKRHVARVLTKLGVVSRHAAAFSYRQNLYETPGEPLSWRTPIAAASETTQLTPREWDVLTRIVNGARNRSIAADLCLSEHTVKRHASRIFSKLGVRSRLQATAFFHSGRLQGRTAARSVTFEPTATTE
jgi:DNA-binding NarL/FixJ family response regulator